MKSVWGPMEDPGYIWITKDYEGNSADEFLNNSGT